MIKYTLNLGLVLKLDAFWQKTCTANSFKSSKFGKWHSVLENFAWKWSIKSNYSCKMQKTRKLKVYTFKMDSFQGIKWYILC